jgi:2-C-methyl-D-erythritol 2,4-cyclodiphosphate synthase
MVASIARVLQLAPAMVNLKAKTAERLGPVGRGEAIEVQAVVLLFGAASSAHAPAIP